MLIFFSTYILSSGSFEWVGLPFFPKHSNTCFPQQKISKGCFYFYKFFFISREALPKYKPVFHALQKLFLTPLGKAGRRDNRELENLKGHSSAVEFQIRRKLLPLTFRSVEKQVSILLTNQLK